ncbi:hypothetical protein MACK_001879 [Theileria orientalis]|uniref:TATA box binding protein associated factor (TAF) histone-like fold domain-containing protein n=1 Tax=Theileria orientalis TaxID=68886 RepID=A0A976MAR1_THEOR|nr:hypothetical protein MACK_001879 [Theileria orientalis]
MKKVVRIPGKAIMALSKTHPLYQNDKAVLSEEAAEIIASTVEMRLKQVLEAAKLLMDISERPINTKVLTPEDVRNALKALNIPDLDGYSNSYDYRYVWATKLFKGDRVVKRESTHRNLGDKSWGRYRLSQLVKQDLQKPIPAPAGLTVSWAVVDAKVPLMAKGLVEDTTKEYEKWLADTKIKKKLGEISFLDYAETEEKLDNLTTLVKNIRAPESDLSESFSNEYLDKALIDAINKQIVQDNALVKNQKFVIPKVDYLLTKEHKFFLKEIRNMLKRASYSLEPDIQMQYKKVTELLRVSLGLDQLLPELCYLFTTEMNRFKSSQSSFNVNILLQYVEALTSNQNIQIHHYVHQLLVPLLEILLSSDNDMDPTEIYSSLLLRKLSAQCIYNISYNLKRNNNGLESIDSYLMNLYKKEITNENCTLSVLFGALCGIAKLPAVAKRVIFYPIVPLLLSVVLNKQNSLNIYTKNKQKQKIQLFKQTLLHEILHLILEIIYDSSFEDVMSTLEDTGSLFTVSYEANILVNDVLMGSVNSSVNPELLLQIYIAILNKCHTLLISLNGNNLRLKRKFDELSNSKIAGQSFEDEHSDLNNGGLIVQLHGGNTIVTDHNNSQTSNDSSSSSSTNNSSGKLLPEVYNIRNYKKLYNKANDPNNNDKTVSVQNYDHPKSWYNFNSIHSLTLTI